eukprot:maker-scaffold_7-snap-gene-16.4-mRNA-1 protein AED:0.01 eAED:0.01 QI:251/1/1/1/1/1/2/310/418
MKKQKPAQVLLQREFRKNKKSPHSEFFQVYELVNDNIQMWEVYLIGPPNTLYENGVYKAHLKFPDEYPMKPPSIQFLCEILHPNIYKDGKVCISTLQNGPDGSDELGQYWRPVLGIEQAILSVVSLLSDPNIEDPANTGAASMYKNDPSTFKQKCAMFAKKSMESVPADFEFPKLVKPVIKKKPVEKVELREDVETDFFEYDPEDLTDYPYEDSEAPSRVSRAREIEEERIENMLRGGRDDKDPSSGDGRGFGRGGSGPSQGGNSNARSGDQAAATDQEALPDGNGANGDVVDSLGFTLPPKAKFSELGYANRNYQFFDDLSTELGLSSEFGAAEENFNFFEDAAADLSLSKELMMRTRKEITTKTLPSGIGARIHLPEIDRDVQKLSLFEDGDWSRNIQMVEKKKDIRSFLPKFWRK